MSEATDALARAHARAEARERAYKPVDYDALNKAFKRQKAALTRAINSGDAEKVVDTCTKTVREWNEAGFAWPDDWSRWQRALDDALGYGRSVRLDDLA